jgi:1-deoxy-D-xylulose-5-phosphate synthase
MYPILDRIRSVKDLRKLDHNALRDLSAEIREYIVDVVSHSGGHLAPSLGVVELTVALHYVFDTPRDRIIWDVGHQCYAHKILTGRKKEFATMRTFGGLSGFPKVTESEFDTYNVGHSSTSLSLAIGEAVARDLAHGKQKIVAVIGDGSLTGGLSYEALNQIGSLNKDLIIVLNDNDHSISRNVGAMSAYLTKLISGSIYNRIRRRYYNFLKKIPGGGGLWSLFKKVESRIKGLILPGQIFEELGIRYFGPIDGHNIEQLIELFERLKAINSGPKMVHIITKKGKGYPPAEKNPARFHGVGPFVKKNGEDLAAKKITWSDVAGETLARIARDDRKIIAVTAAMKDGTGLAAFEKVAPKRLFDVGIAEQHAVTFSTALARNGYKPFVAIYSTFLQRAYDQLVHDTAIMNLPVTFLVDRAGIVGEDGETHQGLLDLVFLKSIPNFTVLAPSSGAELRDMIRYAATRAHGPLAIRYPRGEVPDQNLSLSRVVRAAAFPSRELSHGKDVALLCVGEMIGYAERLDAALLPLDIRVRIVDLRSVKPLDMNTITKAVKATRYFVTLECGHQTGGVGEEIVARLECGLRQRYILSVSFPDRFITHGKTEQLFEEYGISVERSAANIAARFTHGKKGKGPRRG